MFTCITNSSASLGFYMKNLCKLMSQEVGREATRVSQEIGRGATRAYSCALRGGASVQKRQFCCASSDRCEMTSRVRRSPRQISAEEHAHHDEGDDGQLDARDDGEDAEERRGV